jgi:hypothetical protein
MKIHLHKKDLGDITLRELLPQKIEFGKKVLDQGIHEKTIIAKLFKATNSKVFHIGG